MPTTISYSDSRYFAERADAFRRRPVNVLESGLLAVWAILMLAISAALSVPEMAATYPLQVLGPF